MSERSNGDLRTKADWLRLIETCKQVEGRNRLRLTKRFIVRYGNQTEIIPPGTEVIFFCLYTGPKGTTQKFRTEGVFYLADGRTLSILGYYGRKVPRGREREHGHAGAVSGRVCLSTLPGIGGRSRLGSGNPIPKGWGGSICPLSSVFCHR